MSWWGAWPESTLRQWIRITEDHDCGTRVSLRHTPGSFRLTTGGADCPPEWLPKAREKINTAAREGCGRAFFCIDTHFDQMVAAATYHIERRPESPLIITAFAFNPTDPGRTGAGLIKKHIELLAHLLGRPLDVHAVVGTEDMARYLKRHLRFQNAAAIPGFNPRGQALLVEPAS